MRRIALLLVLALAVPALAQNKKPKKPAAHSRPTPQQIRKFDELEKKENKIQGRSPNSGGSSAKAIRAPSPK